MSEPELTCTCYVTDPSTWFYYGSAVEPGSQMEPNPECPVHFPKSEPVCDCYPGGFTPETYEGPMEDCPVHGRGAP